MGNILQAEARQRARHILELAEFAAMAVAMSVLEAVTPAKRILPENRDAEQMAMCAQLKGFFVFVAIERLREISGSDRGWAVQVEEELTTQYDASWDKGMDKLRQSLPDGHSAMVTQLLQGVSNPRTRLVPPGERELFERVNEARETVVVEVTRMFFDDAEYEGAGGHLNRVLVKMIPAFLRDV